MKKKLLFAIIVLTCAFCLVFALAGCKPAANNQSGNQQETPGGQGSGSSDSEESDEQGGEQQGGNSDEHVHIYGELIPEQPATCTAEGMQAHYYCEGCEKYFDSEKHETTLEQLKISIDPNAHNYKFKCSQTEHWQVCTDCGEETAHITHSVSDGVCPACGYVEKCTEGLEFTKLEENEEIIGYSVSMGTATDSHIFIPSFYNNLPVLSIGSYAFTGCTSLESITIPDSVTSIGSYAFTGCTSLESITIPDSVTSIGNYAFTGCTSLKEITILASVTSIGSAFLNTAYYNNADNWKNDVLYIGNYLIMAKYTLSGSYQIVPGTKLIADSAFVSCESLTEITIPNSVSSIGSSAFYGCTSLERITVDKGNKAYRSECNCLIETETKTVILGCKNSTIPQGVTSIGDNAFYRCMNFTEITIPESVTSIGDYAFEDCISLTEIAIPASVTSIGDYAFTGCISLERITVEKDNKVYRSENNCIIETKTKTVILGCNTNKIPEGVTSIGNGAFHDCCYSLTEITIPQGVTSIGDEAFYGCTSLEEITIPDSVTSIGEGAFEDCTRLKGVYINDIASWCNIDFKDYLANPLDEGGNLYLKGQLVTNLEISNGVTSIKNYAFTGCKSLTEITLGNSVTSIGDYAFEDCKSLTEINIPNSVTSIGEHAFEGCTSLKEITIPDSITSIGSYAFSGCTSLTKITIPNSVTSIGDYAFYETAYYNDADNWKNDVLYINNCLIAARNKLSDSYQIAPGTKLIADGAFKNCRNLENVTIPESVTSIGRSAFYGCRGLTRVIFENTAGWKVSENSDMSNSEDINVSDPEKNAIDLIRYYNYYWERG